jgi:hypothetical protein
MRISESMNATHLSITLRVNGTDHTLALEPRAPCSTPCAMI